LALLTLLFVQTGLAFAIFTPMFQNPDEPTQVDMVRHYAAHPTQLAGPSLRQTDGLRGAVAATGLSDAIPDFATVPDTRPDYGPFTSYRGGNAPATTDCPVTCQNYQYGHPPAWYLLTSPIAWITEGRAFPRMIIALRAFNVLMVSVVVWCTWYIARQVWPARPRRALIAAALTVAFAPLASAASAANNDALVFALMAVTLALIARVLRHGARVTDAMALGALVSLGLLTKGQFLVIAPLALVAVLVAPSQDTRLHRAIHYVVFAAYGGFWWLRVLVDTHSVTPRGSELVALPSAGPWQSVGFVRYLFERSSFFADRFGGLYGCCATVMLSSTWRTIVELVLLALIIGWLVRRRWTRPTPFGWRLFVLGAAPVLLFLAVALSSYDTFRRNGEIRGMWPRYVYGAVPVLAVGVAALIASAGDRLRRIPQWAVAVAVAGLVGGGVGVSFFEAMRGVYDTSSLSVMIDRAGIVAPVSHPARWLAAIGLLWIVTLAATSWAVAECWVRRAETRAVVRGVRIGVPQPSIVASESPGDLNALRWTMANHTHSNNNSHARQATATAAASPSG
jgi:4-amino-4-deoxy-L-arabinose transferase-like glycosyltransferase